jgi:hypothetical protein
MKKNEEKKMKKKNEEKKNGNKNLMLNISAFFY